MKREYIYLKMNRIVAGDHMVLLYENEDYHSNTDVIVAYILSRINRNEKCIYIKGGLSTEIIINKLKNLIDLDSILKNEQLLILDKEDAYSKSGTFNARKMIELIKTMSKTALAEGFSALAITGEISWVLNYNDGFDRIMEYEYLLNEEIFNSYPVSAICRYNIDSFSNKMIKNIIEVHPIIIYRGLVHENPFYFDVVDSDSVDLDKFQVDSMLNTIEKFTSTKSRFKSEIEIKEKQYQELQLKVLKDMIITLTGLLEIHDVYTKNHSQKVANYSREIAEAMNLSEDRINQIYYAGLVHDIGKALIPKEVLNKKGRLTDEEYELVKLHPLTAYKSLVKNSELENLANIVLEHHERWDGLGYPNHIKGEEILLESRILSIADTFDAMTSNRPYRKAFSIEYAILEIEKMAGTQFDPKIAKLSVDKVFNKLL
ncbi:MAG: HD domain-containing phosphohydrolase [Pleomorphochaeta sp.]